MGRVSSPLLLVGSLPADSTETALRRGAELFSDLVFALPDGETGPRAAWVGYERNHLWAPHPDVEVVRPTPAPNGIPRHAYEVPIVRIKPGVEDFRVESWPRIDAALESYEVFATLRDEGVIPEGVRFQVGLPGAASAIVSCFQAAFASDYPRAERAYDDLVAREIARLLERIPARDLAIQWDLAYETLDLEGILAWTPEGAWERYIGPMERMAGHVPEEVLMGIHLCYGTFPEWPMFEARDMGLLVRMANAAVEAIDRPVDWLHLAGPRYLRSEEDAFFAPLEGLRAPDSRVYLGIVLPVDGVPGLERRARTAARHLADFGVAMYCGFGRQPGQDPDATMREHRETVLAVGISS